MGSFIQNFRDQKSIVKVEKRSARPDAVWNRYKLTRSKRKLEPLRLDTPVFEDKLRFVCISDTHNRGGKYETPIPDGDVLLHCGDFTQHGSYMEVIQFSKFLENLPHKKKIVIGGNHDTCIDKTFRGKKVFGDPDMLRLHRVSEPIELVTRHSCYLEDSYVMIGGYKIYGAPWTPEYCSMGFNYKRGEQAMEIWNRIPDDADVVMTHGPALGYGDKTTSNHHVGCADLLNTIQKRVRPMYLVSGHIHESNGQHTDGATTFINAAICDRRYRPSQPAHIFDLPLRQSQDKASVLAEELHPVSCLPTESNGLDSALGALKLE